MKIACAYLFDKWYTGWLYRFERRSKPFRSSMLVVCHVVDSNDFSDEEVISKCVKTFSSLSDAKTFADNENEAFRKFEENEP